MNIKQTLIIMGIFLLTALCGWIFVEVLNEFTWMVNGMDDILWAIIYLASIMVVCTYCLIKAVTNNRVK